jgi:DNTP-hexose dehydratase-epimerase
MRYLITGGCGFIGSNLAAKVMKLNEELFVVDNLYRIGSSQNLAWLQKQGRFTYYNSDIRDNNAIEAIVKDVLPDYIFHLSGQVAMTTSLQNPRLDYEINALGTFNLLDAVRKYSSKSIILYSSTNKVYGDFDHFHFMEDAMRYTCVEYPKGFPETLELNFHSPYGCSKGCADQYLLDFHRMYGIKTIVFRHSSMYGTNQHATFDQGWIAWFCHQALAVQRGQKGPLTIQGTGKQVRDLLYCDDVVRLYFMAKDVQRAYGQAFNIGGGVDNSLSLLELFEHLEQKLNIKIRYKQLRWRESDQKVFVADIRKAWEIIGWKPTIGKREGIERLLRWLNFHT